MKAVAALRNQFGGHAVTPPTPQAPAPVAADRPPVRRPVTPRERLRACTSPTCR